MCDLETKYQVIKYCMKKGQHLYSNCLLQCLYFFGLAAVTHCANRGTILDMSGMKLQHR